MELHVLPLRRTLAFTAGDNLLEVLERAGVALSHSCRAGRCGTCRCRVLKGDVLDAGQEQRRPLDAALPYVLACQTVLTGDCTIEIPPADDVVVHPARLLNARVTGLEPLSHDVMLLRLRANKPLSFSPGQYAQLTFAPGHVRPYSMAGLMDDDELSFHIRLVPDGRVTRYIGQQLQVGDAVRVSGPMGSAYLRPHHTGPMLCMATGTGLAPVLSIVRGTLAAGMTNAVHLYVGARTARDVYARDTLQALARAHPSLQLHGVLSEAGSTLPGWRHGLVTNAVEQDLRDLTGWRAYLCGSPPMVEAASFLVRRLGMLPDHVHADAFYPSGT